MSTPSRIATFNMENLTDEPPENFRHAPDFQERLAVLRPPLRRFRFRQEVPRVGPRGRYCRIPVDLGVAELNRNLQRRSLFVHYLIW